MWANIILRFFRGLIQVLVATCDDPHSNHIFFGLISTFCMDLFSSIARGTKATGKEFGPCKKVQISPKIRKSLHGVGIGIEIFLTWEQYGKM